MSNRFEDFDNFGPITWRVSMTDRQGHTIHIKGDSLPSYTEKFGLTVTYLPDPRPLVGRPDPIQEALNQPEKVIDIKLPNPQTWTTWAPNVGEDDLRDLVAELLWNTDPYPGALEERCDDCAGGLANIWERLAKCIGFTRSADQGSPTKWDK